MKSSNSGDQIPRTAYHPLVVFDLDGTLVDFWPRVYALFYRYMSRFGKKPAILSQYKAWKFSGSTEADIAAHYLDEPQRLKYAKWKFRHIEDPEMLKKDTLITGCLQVLQAVSKKCPCIVLTSRQHNRRAHHELQALGIHKFIKKLITSPGENYVEAKSKALRHYLSATYSSGITPNPLIFVGDTEREIELARCFHGVSVAIPSGVRSKEYLASKKPDHMLQTITLLPQLLDTILSKHT